MLLSEGWLRADALDTLLRLRLKRVADDALLDEARAQLQTRRTVRLTLGTTGRHHVSAWFKDVYQP